MPMIAHLAGQLFNAPLFAQPHYAEVVTSVLADRLGVMPMLAQTDITVAARPSRSPMLTQAGVLVLPIVGGLMHRGTMMDAMSGTQSYANIQNRLAEGLDESDVRAILLDVDSPGGMVGGCIELADLIFQARGAKPIWAIANTAAYSAAYALAAAAEKFYASPSAGVGSIGVVWMHTDVSKALEKKGIVTSFVYRGARKLDGNPVQPLSNEARAEMEARAEEQYAMLVDAVARFRGIDAKDVRKTEAASYGAEKAFELGLVDGVKPLQAVMTALEESLQSSSTPTITYAKGSPIMTKPTEQPAAVQQSAGISNEAHAAAVATAERTAYARGRADAGAILALPEAEGRTALAAELASNADIKPDTAKSLLAKSEAKQVTGVLGTLMAGKTTVGAGAGSSEADSQAAREAELAKIGKGVSAARYRN